MQLQSLSQEAASSRQLYDALYGKLKELNIQSALRATNIGIANPALPPAKPTRPNPPLYLAIGLIAGLFFGVSSAFVREHMDDTVTRRAATAGRRAAAHAGQHSLFAGVEDAALQGDVGLDLGNQPAAQ